MRRTMRRQTWTRSTFHAVPWVRSAGETLAKRHRSLFVLLNSSAPPMSRRGLGQLPVDITSVRAALTVRVSLTSRRSPMAYLSATTASPVAFRTLRNILPTRTCRRNVCCNAFRPSRTRCKAKAISFKRSSRFTISRGELGPDRHGVGHLAPIRVGAVQLKAHGHIVNEGRSGAFLISNPAPPEVGSKECNRKDLARGTRVWRSLRRDHFFDRRWSQGW
jgi:hypothetical protein